MFVYKDFLLFNTTIIAMDISEREIEYLSTIKKMNDKANQVNSH